MIPSVKEQEARFFRELKMALTKSPRSAVTCLK